MNVYWTTIKFMYISYIFLKLFNVTHMHSLNNILQYSVFSASRMVVVTVWYYTPIVPVTITILDLAAGKTLYCVNR